MQPGSRWKHHEGGHVKLLACARLEATGEPYVIYKPWEDGSDYGPWWCRPLFEWEQEVAPGVKRFVRIDP